MARVGLTEAARLTGRQRSTILRAIQAGRLAEHRDGQGRRVVDVAELQRLWELRATGAPAGAPADDLLRIEAEARRAREDADRERSAVAELRAEVADLRRRLDAKDDQVMELVRTVAALRLTAPVPEPAAAPVPPPPAAKPEQRDRDAAAEDSLVRRIEAAANALGIMPDFLRIRRR